MQQAKEILSKHWYKATGKQLDELTLNHLQYAVDAIAEALHTKVISCNHSCGPSDFYKGGKCDKNGCYPNPSKCDCGRPLKTYVYCSVCDNDE